MPAPLAGAGPLSIRRIGREGPAVVLIHGLGRSALGWWRTVAAHDGSYRLFLPDNPGQGGSASLRTPLSLRAHTELHLRTLDAVIPGEGVHVVGLSLGGMIALSLSAALGPKRCLSVTSLSASSLESGFWRLDPRSLLRTGLRCLRRLSFGFAVVAPELLSAATLEREPGIVAMVEAIEAAEPARPGTRLRQLLAATGFRAKPLIAHLPERRHAVVGQEDRFVPPRNSERLARLLDLSLLSLPQAGHDLGFDAPEDVARILSDVAAGRAPSPSRLP